MILFEKDWARFPRAIADFKTSNQSFIDLVMLYRHMGVKNCLFPLALMQPELQGVDPHDPNLDEVTQTRIKIECKFNPWYYLREVVRVPPVSGDTPVQLRANRANISLWWCFLNHIDYFLVQIRQTGKSLNTDVLHNWYQIFGTENTRANLFTKDADLIKENIARLKKIRKLLPPYLVNIVRSDTDNQKEFTNYGQGNRLVAVQAQANEDAALNIGRGLTAAMNHIDEVAFLRFVQISVPAMLAGSGAAREEAARNGLPYGNIFTSTAGKLDSEEGSFAYKLLSDSMVWDECVLDCEDQKALYKVVSARCKTDSLMVNGTFSHRQLGFTDEWLRKRIADSKQSGDDARRDFLNEWTAGSLSNPLPTSVLETIRKHVIDAPYSQVFSSLGYIIRWYVPKEEVENKLSGRQLVMGVDTSNATGRDSITGVITDVSTLETVGVWSINETNLQLFSGWLARLIANFKGLTVVPENKSTWIAILDYLLIHLPTVGIDPGRRIYSQFIDHINDGDREKLEYKEYLRNPMSPNHYNRWRRYFGFPTNGPLRELLYGSVIQEAGKLAGAMVRDKDLAAEISGLVVKNGRIDHRNGFHDDHVISWLLTHWFLTYAKNLEHYGIDKTLVKRKLREMAVETTDWRAAREAELQKQLRNELEEVLDKIKVARDEYQIMRLEHRLNSIYARLDVGGLGMDAGSIDALIEEARDRRAIGNRQKQQGARQTAEPERYASINGTGRFGGRGGYQPSSSVVMC